MGGQMTPFAKRILVLLVVLYIVQIFALKPDNLTPGWGGSPPVGFTNL